MSIETKPTPGLVEQLKAATTLEQTTTLANEFAAFKYASPKTCRRFARILAQKQLSLAPVDR